MVNVDVSACLVGHSVSIRDLLKDIELAALCDAAVLITGEKGVGKTLIARAIHQRSRRRTAPFTTIDCADVPETLLESKPNGGTLVIESVGELDLRTQAAAVNHLEDQDVRLIAASHEGLYKRVIAGTFREDLYYRLNVIHIAVPPQRRLREDIPTLDQHLLQYQSEARNRDPDVSPAAMERLVESDWPGNVRQIAEIVAQFVARGAVTIDAHHLPQDIFETRRDATEMFG
jgi:DNA-binding NtrC family response regulator